LQSEKCAVIIILVLFLKPIFPVIDYAINYDYISKVLCINKDKPELKCNGKCHLMKELAKASEDDKPISSDKSKVQISLLTFCYRGKFFFFLFQKDNQELNSSYTNLYSHLNSSSIFTHQFPFLNNTVFLFSDSLWRKPMRRSYGASYLRNYKKEITITK
jgi:hypothetical protein